MLTRLYLLRHGETDWNKKSIFQGHKDIDLNQKGKDEAKKAVELFTDIDLDYIYSSDLNRAKNTVKFIAQEKNLEIIESKKIREIDFGDWEGLTFSEIKKKYPDQIDIWQKDPLNNSPSGGENLRDLQQRVKSFFENIIDKHQGEKILVVTHGGVIKSYLTVALAIEAKKFWQFQVDNTSVTELNFFENDVILSKLNFTNSLF